MKRALLAIGLIAACDKGKSKDECRAEAKDVGTLLEAVAREPPSILQVADELQLVRRTDLPPRMLARAPLVTISKSELRHEGKAVAADQLAERLAEAMHTIENSRFHDDEDKLARRTIYFAIDGAAVWRDIVPAVATARAAGFDAPAFVFEQVQDVQPPPRSSVDAELDKLRNGTEPSSRAVELARMLEKLVARCEPLQHAFGAVAATDTDNKAMTLAQSMSAALVACNCNVDIAAFRSTMFQLLYVPRPLRAVRLDPDVAADRVALPGATTWAEASKRFTPSLKNATLELGAD